MKALRFFAFVAVCWAAGCGLPKDPEGTFDRARDGVLRVGITEEPPWTSREGKEPVGIEARLVEQFAAEIGADVSWVWGSEQRLFEALERFELDLVVGGLTQDTPWKRKVGLTKPYIEHAEEKHVLAVAPGENRFLLHLEQFLRRQRAGVERRLGGGA